MEIRRERYLDALVERRHNGMIKVITGIRRCGKSYLIFHIFKNYLLGKGIDELHIISIELDLWQNKRYRNPDEILQYIQSALSLPSDEKVRQEKASLINIGDSSFYAVCKSLKKFDFGSGYFLNSLQALVNRVFEVFLFLVKKGAKSACIYCKIYLQ